MKKSIILTWSMLFALLFTGCSSQTMLPSSSNQSSSFSNEILEDNPKAPWDTSKYKIVCTVELINDKLDLIEPYDPSADRWRYSEIIHPKTIELNFAGNIYTGNYCKKEYEEGIYHPLYEYEMPDGNSFKIDEEGMINYFSLFNTRSSVDFDYNNVLSKEECINIAKEIFEDYYGKFVDTSSYHIYSVQEYEFSSSEEKNERDMLYYITFSKYIGDIRAADMVTVALDLNGNIHLVHANTCGRVPDDIDVSTIDTKEVDLVLDSVINYIYEDSRDKYNFRISRSDLFVDQIGDKSFGIGSVVEVETLDKNDSPIPFNPPSRYNLYVKLEEPS